MIWTAQPHTIDLGSSNHLLNRSEPSRIAETKLSNRGLGYLVQTGAMICDTTQLFVAILAATTVVHAFLALVDLGERFLLRWRPRGMSLIVDHGT